MLIHIAHEVPANKFAAIQAHLNHVSLHDVNFNGVEFDIERDDFTCIPGDDSPAKVKLINQIFGIIEQ